MAAKKSNKKLGIAQIPTKRPKDVAIKVKVEQTRTRSMHFTQVFAALLLIMGVLLLIYVNSNVDTENLQERFGSNFGTSNDTVNNSVDEVVDVPEFDLENRTSGDYYE